MKIKILPDHKTIDIQNEQTILDASLAASIAHAHVCGGSAKCSSCRVIVLEGIENCCPRNEDELDLAHKLGFTKDVRLACQTTVSGPIKIRRPVLDEIDIQMATSVNRNGVNSIGEEKEATMLFADIEGYTAFAEASMPYDVVHMLNRYYYQMGKVIKTHNGFIMDYFGDGFLAIFGLEDNATHALDAVNAGIEMQAEIQKINPYFKNLFGKDFNVRIGVSSGKVIVGSIGLTGMRKLAAIGDAVNFAARIEAANKDLKTKFLISESTYIRTKDKVAVKNEFEISVKGKTGIHKVFEV
ncbi:MAG: adenylate cyclase [Saprospiraceae bacterium]|jgi:adenylate cyclase